jgi:N-carbamoyl-L-amino-acid hydrolase
MTGVLPGQDPSLRQLAGTLFASLREASHDGVGITRETYGESETRAMALVAAAAEAEGLAVATDAAANLVVTLPGADAGAPFIACGSHLDSVPEGGNYDGAAGVLAGLLGMIALKRRGVVPERSVKLFALRGEESAWFGQAYLGSRALLGVFAAEDLALPHRSSGESLGRSMRAAGADVERIRRGERLLEPAEVACYLELHIEQGPVMVARGVPVGVVTGIRGNHRHPTVRCIGEAAHSGAVPRWLRRDAVFAVSEFIMRLDRHWQAILEQGQDLVVTVGVIETSAAEAAMSRVPGHVQFALEFRSESTQLLADFESLVHVEAEGIERLRGVRFEFDPPRATAPATMSPSLCQALAAICDDLGTKHELLPSGAGHDAAVFANQGIPSAMIFVRNEQGSHNPNEAMDMDDFFLGVDVLTRALLCAHEAL